MTEFDSFGRGRRVEADVTRIPPAAAELYLAAQFEEAKLFAVADMIADQFMSGSLAIGSHGQGPATEKLYAWLKSRSMRMAEPERRSHYLRAFGFAGGKSSPPTIENSDFVACWTRFVTAASQAQPISTPGHELARNLAQHVTRPSSSAALELTQTIKAMLELFGQAEIQAAYGGQDSWTLVEQVAKRFLGGAVDLVRARTLASTGSNIVRWLASHLAELDSQRLQLGELRAWCEGWLAAAAASSPARPADWRPKLPRV